jgi:hypothetical protein
MRRSRPQKTLILTLIALIQLAIAPVTGPLACRAGLSGPEHCCCRPAVVPEPPCCELEGAGMADRMHQDAAQPQDPAPVDPDEPCDCGLDRQPIAQCEPALWQNGDDGHDLAALPPTVGTEQPRALVRPEPNARRSRALGRDGPPLYVRLCSYLI